MVVLFIYSIFINVAKVLNFHFGSALSYFFTRCFGQHRNSDKFILPVLRCLRQRRIGFPAVLDGTKPGSALSKTARNRLLHWPRQSRTP